MSISGLMARDSQTILDLSSPVGFSVDKIPPEDSLVYYAVIQAIDGNIRFTVDGKRLPTASEGMRLGQDTTAEIWGASDMANFKAIAEAKTPQLEVVYVGRQG